MCNVGRSYGTHPHKSRIKARHENVEHAHSFDLGCERRRVRVDARVSQHPVYLIDGAEHCTLVTAGSAALPALARPLECRALSPELHDAAMQRAQAVDTFCEGLVASERVHLRFHVSVPLGEPLRLPSPPGVRMGVRVVAQIGDSTPHGGLAPGDAGAPQQPLCSICWQLLAC